MLARFTSTFALVLRVHRTIRPLRHLHNQENCINPNLKRFHKSFWKFSFALVMRILNTNIEIAPKHPLFQTNLDWRSKFYGDTNFGLFWLKYFAQYRKHNASVLNRPNDKQTFYPSTAFGLLCQLRTVHEHAHHVFVDTELVHLDTIQVLLEMFPAVIPMAVAFTKEKLVNEVGWKGWIEEFNDSQMGNKYRVNNSRWWKDWYLRIPSTRFTISPDKNSKNIREGANVWVTLENGSKVEGKVTGMQVEKSAAFIEVQGVENHFPMALHFIVQKVEQRSRSQPTTTDTSSGKGQVNGSGDVAGVELRM